ncbi:MAG: TrmB family transcriptional regulator [Cyanobacteria bacterium SIG26]|nr:TrmB family transcriptional regulator [Cyanobacteria bacterium SIG26]
MDNLIEKLKEFGFNSYEAKVYIALLKKYPATGYEVAQNANIPQSRAYDALKSLCTESIVIATNDKPQKYNPVSPKELTKRFKRKINSTIDYLEKKLPKVKQDYNEPIHQISDYDSNIEKLKEIINNSKQTIYLEIWNEDFKQIEKELTEAYDRGVDVKIVGYDNINYICATVYNHDGARDIEYATGSRMVYILSDNNECLFGRIELQVIWTQNCDIAYLLKEFITHDMYLLDVYQRFPEQLKYFYGTGFKKLKDKILDKKSVYNNR